MQVAIEEPVRIFVTGASEYIGDSVAEHLRDLGQHEVGLVQSVGSEAAL